MNNSVNVQSPSFGMAYKIGNLKEMVKYLNRQEPEVINQLNIQMKEAAEKLKETKYADAVLYADNEGKKLYHNISWRIPVFTEEGKVATSCSVIGLDENINNAVEETLKKEKAMTAAYEYAQKQAELLGKLAQK